MAVDDNTTERIPGYCALCVSRCGSIAVVEDGRFVALEPDPSHPTGKALCAKGFAAPELVYHPDRLLYPLKRTRPKGDPDPGWERITWDEALDITATRMRDLAREHGPESIAFGLASPSTSALSESIDWIDRLMRAFGSPNILGAMELCGWGRYFATLYTFGDSVPGVYMPDLANAGCIMYWGYNPTIARLAHATETVAALKRGARLIVVDPRRAGLASRADVWMRVRPGTDAALALGIANVMIQRGWFDVPFIREWTNGPLLVRNDNGQLLTMREITGDESQTRYAAWDLASGRTIPYDQAIGRYDGESSTLALFGEYSIETSKGSIACRPAFEFAAQECRRNSPERVEDICGIPRDEVEAAARLLWENPPVAYYAWSGVEQQTNATQTARAIAQLYALTGCFDAPGGNVKFASVPASNVASDGVVGPEHTAPALGLAARPLGPSRFGFVTSDEVYRGILEQQPYGVHGLIGFGTNMLLSHADSARGRDALKELDFFVHADLFMNPTAELADIVLPVASAFERAALNIGFEVSADAQSFVQLRPRVVEPRGEARSDTEIVFDLACRLGLGASFWDGDIDAGYRFQLEPTGVSLEMLREHPEGVRVPLVTQHRKFAVERDGVAAGFATPTRKIELYSEMLLKHGYPPVPVFEEPLVSPRSRPDLAARYPLILTCSKHTMFCESQHRGLPTLRRRAMDPQVELHPSTAAERGIAAGDWVSIETPEGSVRARARMNDSLEPGVVVGQHGWWQACPEIGAEGYDPFSAEGANLNLIIGNEAIDPISGSVPHRAYVCEVRRG